MQYIFWRERCSVLLQKHQYFLLSTSSFLSSLCLHFEAFRIQNDGKRSTKIERLIQSALKEILADFNWKMAKTDRKKSKKSEICWFPSSSEFC